MIPPVLIVIELFKYWNNFNNRYIELPDRRPLIITLYMKSLKSNVLIDLMIGLFYKVYNLNNNNVRIIMIIIFQ